MKDKSSRSGKSLSKPYPKNEGHTSGSKLGAFDSHILSTPGNKSNNVANSIFTRITSAIATPFSGLLSRFSPKERQVSPQINDNTLSLSNGIKSTESAFHDSSSTNLAASERRQFTTSTSGRRPFPNSISLLAASAQRKTDSTIERNQFNSPAYRKLAKEDNENAESLLSNYLSKRKNHLNVEETEACLQVLEQKASNLLHQRDSEVGQSSENIVMVPRLLNQSSVTGRGKIPVYYGSIYGSLPSGGFKRRELRPVEASKRIKSLLFSKQEDVHDLPMREFGEVEEVKNSSFTFQSLEKVTSMEPVKGQEQPVKSLGKALSTSSTTNEMSSTARLILNALSGSGTAPPGTPVSKSSASQKADIGSVWTCNKCSNVNPILSSTKEKVCLKCSSLKESNGIIAEPRIEASVSLAQSAAAKKKEENIAVVKASESSKNWTCPCCLVNNGGEKEKCICCETPNPALPAPKPASAPVSNSFGGFTFGAPATAPVVQPPAVKTSSSSSSSTASGKWTCSSCLVPNEADKKVCICCESPNPNLPKAPPSAIAPPPSNSFGGFTFGAPVIKQEEQSKKADNTDDDKIIVLDSSDDDGDNNNNKEDDDSSIIMEEDDEESNDESEEDDDMEEAYENEEEEEAEVEMQLENESQSFKPLVQVQGDSISTVDSPLPKFIITASIISTGSDEKYLFHDINVIKQQLIRDQGDVTKFEINAS